MLKVGITGGIGTGKTTVCTIFSSMGIPVYYADDRAKWLMQHDENLVAQLKAAFGEQVYAPDGQLDRAYLSSLVFNNAEQLNILNGIVHPAVFMDGFSWEQEMAEAGHAYVLREAALLVETGSYKLLDKLIVVSAPLELRIERVMARDNCSREAVLSRIDKQLPEAEKLKLADFVIQNDGVQSLVPQVWEIHQALTESGKM
jgi:dephospho-CoA kinase